MTIAGCTRADVPDWIRLRHMLWPDCHPERSDAEGIAQSKDALTLIARDENGAAIGFAEATLRHDYVNGCDTSPVAFLEGVYVVPERRRQGIARKLCGAVETWARERGCTEFASDAGLDNVDSHKMHEALGFTETERVVCFHKLL